MQLRLGVERPGSHAELLLVKPVLVFQLLPVQAIVESLNLFVSVPVVALGDIQGDE